MKSEFFHHGKHKGAVVAPLVGAWIEMDNIGDTEYVAFVAPLVGAWIEILINVVKLKRDNSRSSCRSVD